MGISTFLDTLASLVLELWDRCACVLVVLLCALSLSVLFIVFCLILHLLEVIEKWDAGFLDQK
jgi:hypothetical protein